MSTTIVPTAGAGPAPGADGRHLRSSRSRQAIAAAILELVNDGALRPTAEAIAERAGMSVRTVFRHLADRDALDVLLVDLHVERTGHLFDPPPYDGDRRRRVAALAAHRRRLYETIGNVRRAVQVHAPFAEALRTRVETANRSLRDQLPLALAPELAVAGPHRRTTTLAAVEMATSWAAWQALRDDQGLDARAAEATVAATVDALLDALLTASGSEATGPRDG